MVIAIERRGNGSGRVRMEAFGDSLRMPFCRFVEDNVARGSTVKTDAWQDYKRLARLGYDHQPKSQRAGLVLGEDIGEVLPRAHRIISNLKTWLQGTYRGVSDHQLQAYLNEFVFRFNRRRTPMAALQTLLGIGASLPPTTYERIKDGAFAPAELTG